jgi:hypothetical protein
LNLRETAFYIKPNASSKKAKEDYVQLAIRKQAKQQAIDSKKAVADTAWLVFNAAIVCLVASVVSEVEAVISPSPIL